MKKNLYRNPRKEELIKAWDERAKYIALCEGDDYWTDPLKLQKQVDFLEGHPEFSMCFHAAEIKNEIGIPFGWIFDNIENRSYSATELFENWIVPTASIVCRCSVLAFPIKHPENILNGDIFLVEKCAHCGLVFGIKEKMSVYRIQPEGVSYNVKIQEERSKRYPNHFKELKASFPLVERKVINRAIAGAYFGKGSYEKCVVMKCVNFAIGAVYCPMALVRKVKRFLSKRKAKVFV